MAFTTWAALKQLMLDDLASGAWRVERYQVGDVSTSYRSLKEFMEGLDYVTAMAAQESGGAIRRTYASHPRSTG